MLSAHALAHIHVYSTTPNTLSPSYQYNCELHCICGSNATNTQIDAQDVQAIRQFGAIVMMLLVLAGIASHSTQLPPTTKIYKEQICVPNRLPLIWRVLMPLLTVMKGLRLSHWPVSIPGCGLALPELRAHRFWSFNLRLSAHWLIESLLAIFSQAYYHTKSDIILIYTELWITESLANISPIVAIKYYYIIRANLSNGANLSHNTIARYWQLFQTIATITAIQLLEEPVMAIEALPGGSDPLLKNKELTVY